MKLFSSSIVQLVLVATILAAIWSGANQMNRNLAELPVNQVQQVSSAEPVAAMSALFPVSVGKVAPRAPMAAAGDVEGAFKQETAASTAETEPVEPQYAEQLRGRLKVDGVTSNGAFINGRFYAAGASMGDLQMQRASGEALVPRLVRVSAHRIVVMVGTDTLAMEQGSAGWE